MKIQDRTLWFMNVDLLYHQLKSQKFGSSVNISGQCPLRPIPRTVPQPIVKFFFFFCRCAADLANKVVYSAIQLFQQIFALSFNKFHKLLHCVMYMNMLKRNLLTRKL